MTVSYFEWVQNRTGDYWPLEKVHTRLNNLISSEAAKIFDLKEEKNCSMRTAAYVKALERVGSAIEAKGSQKLFQRTPKRLKSQLNLLLLNKRQSYNHFLPLPTFVRGRKPF